MDIADPYNLYPDVCRIHDCDRAVANGSSFCVDHRPCRRRNCPNNRYSLTIPYCRDHSCRGSNCANLGDGTCAAHPLCRIVACTTLAEPGRGYCVQHICSFPRCNRPKVSQRVFCQHHLCQVEGCAKSAVYQGRCNEHEPCHVNGCTSIRQRNPQGDGMEAWCDLHVPCTARPCQSYQSHASLFCQRHKCQIEACKIEKLPNEGQFCIERKCSHDT